MNVKVKNLIFAAEIFAALILMQLIFSAFTIGFNSTEHWLAEIAIIGLTSLSTAVLLFILRTWPREKAGKILYGTGMVTATVLFAAQEVYYAIFGTFFTVYSLINSAQVVEFMDVVFINMWREKIAIVLFFAVGITITVRGIKRKFDITDENSGKKKKMMLLTAVLCVASFGASLLPGTVKSNDPMSPYQNIYGTGEIEGAVRCCGLLGAMEIDFFKLVVGWEPSIEADGDYVKPDKNDNVIKKLDFENIADEEDDKTISTMHEYFGSIHPTEKNEKTGIFKGKNLILITGESFTDFAVDPKYTPTLYKLQTEGYTFTNFYNPLWGVSTLDGEYVNLVGLLPKPGVWSMKESVDNDLPFTLAHQFSKEGYVSKAYHNHSIYYYQRDKSHPNLGYDFKGQGREYSFTDTWPESDLEMIDQTTEDFLAPDENGEIQPFHVYYLTVSGHLEYNFFDDDMAIKNKDAVKDLEMSEACKAYMAANIELDKAMELLLERLEEAGELENTVIALAGDHYPYGLDASEISEFRGHDIDTTYEMYKSTFILWTPGMEPETVDKLSSNLDILPTLSNMFGIEYDSRLLMGKDIFSDSEGFVVFKDKNWISEKGTRNELIKKDEKYVEKKDKKVAEMFNYSAMILDEDYYSYLRPYLSD